MSTGRDFDLIIAGGGVTATALASLLVARGIAPAGRVAVVTGSMPAAGPLPAPGATPAPGSIPEEEWDLRVFALSRASQRLLVACAVWQRLPAGKLCAYERMCVWDAPGEPQGSGSMRFDCAEQGEPNLGFIVEGRALARESRRAAAAAGAVFIEADIAAIASRTADVSIRLRDGRDLHGALLIAADGAESRVRGLLGIDTAGHAYHQDALVAHVRTARPHQNTAWQRFLPTGPLAFLPLPDGRCSIVWSVGQAEAARLRAQGPAAFAAALTEASGGFLGACELTTPIAAFPLQLQYAVDYVRPRAVLVGDAAHAVHPLAGQGLNLGLLDCAVLAEILGDVRATGATSDAQALGEMRVLRRYERRRRSENLLAASAFDGLERLFSSANPAVARLRVAALGAVGRLPFLRRALVARALGMRGDIPAFLESGSAAEP